MAGCKFSLSFCRDVFNNCGSSVRRMPFIVLTLIVCIFMIVLFVFLNDSEEGFCVN